MLDEISEEDLARLPPEAASRLEELRAALESVDRGEAVRDLRGGLEAGSIAMLRRAVAARGIWTPASCGMIRICGRISSTPARPSISIGSCGTLNAGATCCAWWKRRVR